MAREDRPCVVCGVLIEPFYNLKTCSDECRAVLRKRTAQAYYVEHQDEIRPRNREYKREVRGTDPTKFIENRDPEAIKARARERWRRGQANRRARLREAQP